MPSFDLLNRVELYMRAGTFPLESSKSSKKVTKAASKHFIYKDGCLLRSYRGRLLRVVRSDEEVREILARYHDNNSHAGRVRVVKEIMLMYYWVGVTEAVKAWIQDCAVCQSRTPVEPPAPPVQFCLAYGCDASSYVHPQLSFHRFPKDAERRRRWLVLSQRDEGSLRTNSCLCSRHFEPACFSPSEAGQTTLSPDAVPTVPAEPAEPTVPTVVSAAAAATQEDEVKQRRRP
ncbi:THAP domain-containing protein 2 [Liparis tanakae]|uniref:THAP domain-containing protein 1 n=1 Tax=Liparis tanakae TaxID=230148 RepID=A0A4Z2H272_9TELE|nr:THAP domain-containing protein 2 [Liparis tanakae]